MDSERYELIHLAPWRRPIGSYGNRLTFFVLGEPDKALSGHLLTALENRFRGTEIQLLGRSDVWFGSYPEFPRRRVFDGLSSPAPNPKETNVTGAFGVTLLHELGHVFGFLKSSGGSKILPDNAAPDQTAANNSLILDNCSDLLK